MYVRINNWSDDRIWPDDLLEVVFDEFWAVSSESVLGVICLNTVRVFGDAA